MTRRARFWNIERLLEWDLKNWHRIEKVSRCLWKKLANDSDHRKKKEEKDISCELNQFLSCQMQKKIIHTGLIEIGIRKVGRIMCG